MRETYLRWGEEVIRPTLTWGATFLCDVYGLDSSIAGYFVRHVFLWLAAEIFFTKIGTAQYRTNLLGFDIAPMFPVYECSGGSRQSR